MGSGRGDRNQPEGFEPPSAFDQVLQWGPVVVTGISTAGGISWGAGPGTLQWGPVVVTGIRSQIPRRAQAKQGQLQWGPVVVTGISSPRVRSPV